MRHEIKRRYIWHKQALFKGRSLLYGTTWAGWDVANGADYDTTVTNLVNYIWTHEEDDDKSRKLWPNPNVPDNNKGSSTTELFNYNTGYGAPGFLFMEP